MRKPTANPNSPPKRMHLAAGRWYWKPERRLRPTWKSVPLGALFAAAAAEARRLNIQVEAWLKAEATRDPAARRPKVRTGPQTVSQLASAYRASADWKLLRARTAYQYVYEFKRLEAEFGHEPAATLSEERVDDWLDAMRLTAPETGRHVAAKGRLLFKWAARKNMIPRGCNPFLGAKIGQGRKRKVRMKPDDLRTIVAACDAAGSPSIGTALVIGFAAVQRISDVIALTDAHICSGRLQFAQSKSKKVGVRGRLIDGFEVDMALPAMIAQRLADRPPVETPEGWLTACETTKTAWHEKTIARKFQAIRDALVRSDRRLKHLAEIQLRDARRSGFVQYVLDGAGVPFICSMSGHSIDDGMQIVEHYLPKTADQADRAVKLLSVAL